MHSYEERMKAVQLFIIDEWLIRCLTQQESYEVASSMMV